MARLRTFMSPVMSRYPAGDVSESGTLERVVVNRKPLYWLDEMLGGGFELPEDLWDAPDKSPSFVLLLGGPPGTGKTTFALELCYNLARHEQDGGVAQMRSIPWTSLYASLESPGDRIRENAQRFGWNPAYFNRLVPIPQQGPQPPPILEWFCCNILGSEHFRSGIAGTPYNPATNFNALIQRYLQANPRNTLGLHEELFDTLPNLYPSRVTVA